MNIIEPRIIYKPAFREAGIPLNGEEISDRLDAVWEKLADRYSEIPHADPDQGFGVHTFNEQGHHYLAGLAVQKDGFLPEGMAELAIEPHAYAVFTHRGDLGSLPDTVSVIFDNWLPHSGYQMADEFYFEYYDDHFQPGSLDSVIFLFVPVVER
jgi:AraC family transcriptional regulator